MTGWRSADPPGERHFAPLGALTLESGEVLRDVVLAYETWGTWRGDNAILVLHALTGDSHVVGAAGPGHPTPGWWGDIVGPGRPVDTDRFYVVAANILGGCQGSTGPWSSAPDGDPWGRRFPDITVRDQVAAEVALADALGIGRWYAVLGGSAGGMRALEWAAGTPERVERLFLLATTAAASAEQIALTDLQAAVILATPGPTGLDLARRLAHASYRSESELAQRFGRERVGDVFAVTGYLAHHGAKLIDRFDADSYLTLGDAMNAHDVGRGRGGVRAALARVSARTVVAAIDSDRLYPLYHHQDLAEGIADCDGVEVISSIHGHDGFLIETEQVGKLIAALLS